MKKKVSVTIASIGLIGALAITTFAQFPIPIPKLPKVTKEKTEPVKPAPTPSPAADPSPTVRSAPVATQQPAANSDSKPPADPERCSRGAYGVWREDLETTRKQAADYKPGLRDYYVQDFNDRRNAYFWAAISPKERKEWLEDIEPQDHACFVPILDAIAAAAKTTLPTYRPTGYVAPTPAEQRLMRAEIENIEKATVYLVGLRPGAWNIGKNSLGIPTERWRYGVIWLKWPTDDDGYCRAYYVNIRQDYAGGGTYGQSYGYYANVEPVGCPAGK